MFKQVLRRSTNTLRARAFASEASWNSGTPSVEEQIKIAAEREAKRPSRFTKDTNTRYFSDAGVYPLFGVLAIATGVFSWYMAKKMLWSPDVTLTDHNRQTVAIIGSPENAAQLETGKKWVKLENGLNNKLATAAKANFLFPQHSDWDNVKDRRASSTLQKTYE